jgi:hypothetical protein
VLAENGTEPLPQGFVQTTMPKLTRLLLGSSDDELLKSATTAVKNILAHDHQQLFEWRNDEGKAGLEVILTIVGRLLSATVNDHAAGEVGALAAEVVEKAGHERLGPHLPELLRAVAVRLGSAEHAAFIQSLTQSQPCRRSCRLLGRSRYRWRERTATCHGEVVGELYQLRWLRRDQAKVSHLLLPIPKN